MLCHPFETFLNTNALERTVLHVYTNTVQRTVLHVYTYTVLYTHRSISYAEFTVGAKRTAPDKSLNL